MNRKPIFDAVRRLLGRGFKRSEIEALDLAFDLAQSRTGRLPPDLSAGDDAHRLGSLSEEYESGGRGPGTVSGGINDPGGVSYGVYQLASRTGTCAAFVKAEGRVWAAQFAGHRPGSRGFSSAWKAIAADDPQRFRDAQHAFVERTHYRPVVEAVLERTGLDLDSRSHAVRDAVWSCAVQHGGASKILTDAIGCADRTGGRGEADYDRILIEAIYERRVGYVLAVAKNPRLAAGARNQLVAITRGRYPSERAKALEMLGKREHANTDEGEAAQA